MRVNSDSPKSVKSEKPKLKKKKSSSTFVTKRNASYVEKELHSTRHSATKFKLTFFEEKDTETKALEKAQQLLKQQKLNKISAPNFAKIISREKFIKTKEVKTNIYRYTIPNRNLTQSSNNPIIIFK